MKYIKFILSISISLLILFIQMILIIGIATKFSFEGIQELKYQMKIIENANANIVIFIMFLYGIVFSSFIDISKYIDKKIDKIIGVKYDKKRNSRMEKMD